MVHIRLQEHESQTRNISVKLQKSEVSFSSDGNCTLSSLEAERSFSLQTNFPRSKNDKHRCVDQWNGAASLT